MKRILVGSLSFLTGSEIADAVMACGLAAARAGRIELVEIPVRVPDGATRWARFTVGWHLALAAVTSDSSVAELEEPATVVDLLDRVPSLSTTRAVAFTPAEIEEMESGALDF